MIQTTTWKNHYPELNTVAMNANNYVITKLCPEDKEQLNRIETKLNKKKQFVQIRVNK